MCGEWLLILRTPERSRRSPDVIPLDDDGTPVIEIKNERSTRKTVGKSRLGIAIESGSRTSRRVVALPSSSLQPQLVARTQGEDLSIRLTGGTSLIRNGGAN